VDLDIRVLSLLAQEKIDTSIFFIVDINFCTSLIEAIWETTQKGGFSCAPGAAGGGGCCGWVYPVKAALKPTANMPRLPLCCEKYEGGLHNHHNPKNLYRTYGRSLFKKKHIKPNKN